VVYNRWAAGAAGTRRKGMTRYMISVGDGTDDLPDPTV
jgi:hypothetical protein